jgi:hypothetical protein
MNLKNEKKLSKMEQFVAPFFVVLNYNKNSETQTLGQMCTSFASKPKKKNSNPYGLTKNRIHPIYTDLQ